MDLWIPFEANVTSAIIGSGIFSDNGGTTEYNGDFVVNANFNGRICGYGNVPNFAIKYINASGLECRIRAFVNGLDRTYLAYSSGAAGTDCISIGYLRNDWSSYHIVSSTITLPIYSTWEEAVNALNSEPIDSYPITYRLTNATSSGPNEAAVGDTVTVPLTFPEGYGVVNPSSDAYVTCNGVLVSSTYSNGQLVFTMPDPS